MTFRIRDAAVSMAALAWSCAAFAGDTPVYEAAPEWVEPVEVSSVERDPSHSLLVNDTQLRIVEGQLWEYRDFVYKINSLSDLSNVGTLKAQWLPDKGDLIVHEVSILRDGVLIDVLEQGEEMEVLRRERMLERRIIDGSLTATMSVPGLQVGDELRLRYSVTNSDQALGDEVQSQSYLWRKEKNGGFGGSNIGETGEADFARIRASWPENLDVQYQAGPNYDLPEVKTEAGFKLIEVMLPLEETKDLPRDAPMRYSHGTLLQLGTFNGWSEVSSVMAPYYKTNGALDGLDDLRERVEGIRGQYDGELERAVAALELVQEDVRYLLNGLDGGNYLPQDVATTWEKKYGDCKAKTVILLAVLQELGIEAEPVLVSSRRGNFVPVSLPLPGAFDHVLVRAKINGNLYYLDGTSLGANMDTVGNVPAFEYALPIRADGADIEPIKQVLPRAPEMVNRMTVDASAGVDLPTMTTFRMQMFGPRAAQLSAEAEKLTDERKRMIARGMAGGMEMIDLDIVAGNDDSEATLVITGISKPIFQFDGTRGEAKLGIMAGGLQFSPDRSRREWRDIPVRGGTAQSGAMTTTFVLPGNASDYELRDAEAVDVEIAGKRYTRKVVLEASALTTSETMESLGGEIAPENFRAERRKAAAFARQKPMIVVPDDAPRIWRFAMQKDRSSLAPIEDAYAKIIANDPEEVDPYLTRASFRFDTFDFAGSLEDMNKVIELEPTAEYFGQRSGVHAMLGDTEAELADLQEAYALDPTPSRGMEVADTLALIGKLDEAREILEYEDGDEDVREELEVYLAKLDAKQGDTASGMERYAELLADKPNDSYLLNQQCWFMGTWQVNVADGISVCTKAVENSNDTASAIDSRAMMFLRNGMYAEALSDVDAALELDPEQVGSVLLRGLIRLEQGDKGGQADVDEALARDPSLRAQFNQWDFDL